MSQLLIARCAFCGSHVIEDGHRKKRNDTRYCSVNCRVAASRRRKRAERSVKSLEAQIHSVAQTYYGECTDAELRENCRAYMVGLLKSIKRELESMNASVSLQIKMGGDVR